MKIEYGRLSRRAGLERDQHADHLEPSRPAARVTDDDERDGPRPPLEIDEAYGFATRAVHAGARPDPVTGSRNVPIHQTTSYVFEDVDHAAALFNLQTFGYIYSRLTNPTVAALEERVAALEGGRAAVAAASGHAAQLLAFYTLLEPGDHVVAARQLYGGSLTQLRHTFARLGWSVDLRRRHGSRRPSPRRSRSGPRPSSSSRSPTRAASSSTSRRWPTIAHARVDPAHRRQHAGHAVPVPAVRVGRRPRRPLADQVPVRPRHVDGRRSSSSRAGSTGRGAASSRSWPAPTRPTTGSTSSRRSATSGSR